MSTSNYFESSPLSGRHIKAAPPTLQGPMTDNGWIPVVAACRNTSNKSNAYGKLLYRYSDDFCGGVEIRSVRVVRSTPRVRSTWGASGQVMGASLPADATSLEEIPAWVATPDVCDVNEDIDPEQAVYTALALRVLGVSLESNRAGILGRDREKGSVHALLKEINRIGNFTGPFEHIGRVHGSSHNSGGSRFHFQGGMPRVFKSMDFHNVNSENEVGFYATIADPSVCREYGSDDCQWDEDVMYTSWGPAISTELEQYFTLIGRPRSLPTSEWSCG